MKAYREANILKLCIFMLFLFFIEINRVSSEESFPLVQTRHGKIQGTYKESFIGKKYEAYEGIPYAEPPTLERRFEPPQPIFEWKDVLYATKPVNSCIQYVHKPQGNQVQGVEDCLYLNIYTPFKAKSFPVLFVIHSGAFSFGRGSNGAKFLMDKDIIIVTINYRLGPFGFLSTEDDIIPGNMGLKDQNLALQWVSKNIEYFGGDPKKITLIGISAGGASVHYHYLSPMSTGLFQNGISFSGSALGPGKHTENSCEKSKKLAALINCTTDSFPEMITCLKSVPAPLIAEATKNFMPWLYNPFTPFGPVVEKMGKQPFVNRSAVEIINSGDAADVLWIASYVSEEGLYPAAEFVENDTLLKDLDQRWEQISPHLLDYNYTIPFVKHGEIANKIRQHYFGTKSINRSTTKELINMIGDRLYIFDIEKAARLQAQVNKSPVLFLRYEYNALTSVSNHFSKSSKHYGVCHTDDFNMLFENGFINPTIRTEDRAMQIKMIDYVVSVQAKGKYKQVTSWYAVSHAFFPFRFPDFNLGFNWREIDPSKEATDFLLVKSPIDIQITSDNNIGEKKFWSTIDFDENKLE